MKLFHNLIQNVKRQYTSLMTRLVVTKKEKVNIVLKKLIREYHSRLLLYVTCGKNIFVFETVTDENSGKQYYTNIWSIAAWAYIIEHYFNKIQVSNEVLSIHLSPLQRDALMTQSRTKFINDIQSLILELRKEGEKETMDNLYRKFRSIYIGDLSNQLESPSLDFFTRNIIQRELESHQNIQSYNSNLFRQGPFISFIPNWAQVLIDEMGHKEDMIFLKPFHEELEKLVDFKKDSLNVEDKLWMELMEEHGETLKGIKTIWNGLGPKKSEWTQQMIFILLWHIQPTSAEATYLQHVAMECTIKQDYRAFGMAVYFFLGKKDILKETFDKYSEDIERMDQIKGAIPIDKLWKEEKVPIDNSKIDLVWLMDYYLGRYDMMIEEI